MLIYHGLTAQDMDSLIVWPSSGGNIIVSRCYNLLESVELTYQTLVDDGNLKNNPNPELDATLTITNSLEIGSNLMRIGFAPTPEMVVEISIDIGAGNQRLFPD